LNFKTAGIFLLLLEDDLYLQSLTFQVRFNCQASVLLLPIVLILRCFASVLISVDLDA